MTFVWRTRVRTSRTNSGSQRYPGLQATLSRLTLSCLLALIVLMTQSCGAAGRGRPVAFSASDQAGTTQGVPWTFSARNEAGSACLRFRATLPPGRDLDPDSGRLSTSQNCTVLDGADKRGQFQRLVWNQIPGADITYMYGLALVDDAHIEVQFADSTTSQFPVRGGAFIVVYPTSKVMKSLTLKSSGIAITDCHAYGSQDPC
jgi:hypothetical protein